MPEPGDTLAYDGVLFRVEDVEGSRSRG